MAANLSNEVNMGHIQEVKRLLEQGADVNRRNPVSYTTTLLMEAAYTGQADMVCLLLKAGADAAAKNWDGKTARDLAEQLDHREVILAFSELGIK